jgi:hypothetical protein
MDGDRSICQTKTLDSKYSIMDKVFTLRVLNQLVMLEQNNLDMGLQGMLLVLLVQLDRLARTLKHVLQLASSAALLATW